MGDNLEIISERENSQWNDSLTQNQLMVGACNEYAHNVGSERPQTAWILTDYDTWVANPFYTGSPVPHPESGE